MSPSWHELPFLGLSASESNDVAELRAIRWLLQRGVGLRREGTGYKAFDLDTGFGLYNDDLDSCVYQACLALHAALEAKATSAQRR